MLRLSKNKVLYIIFLLLIFIASSLLNNNYIVGGLFLICSTIIVLLINSDSFYENIYFSLLISSVFEYTYFIKGYPKIYLFHVFLVIFTIINIIRVIKNPNLIKTINKKIIWFYSIWFIYIVLSFTWSLNRALTLKYTTIYVMMFVFMFNIILFNNNKINMEKTIKVLGAMFLVSILIGWIEALTANQLPVVHYYDNFSQYVVPPDEIARLKSRPISFFYNPNNFGTYITICFPFLIYLVYFEKVLIKKIIYFIFSAASLITLILTTSRFNIFAFALILASFTIITILSRGIKALSYPVLFTILFIIIYKNASFFSINTDYLTKMNEFKNTTNQKSIESSIGKDGSENVRLTIAYDIIQGITAEKHYFGFGAGNSSQFLINKGNTHETYNPHGWFIELFGDFGFPFIIFYVTSYVYLTIIILKKSKNREDKSKYLAFSIVSSLIGFLLGSFSPSSVVYFLPNWMIFGIALSYANYKIE